jgi:hypothetical protein
VGRLSRLATFTHMKAILELANQGRSDVCETICRSDSRTRHPCIVSNVHTKSVRSSNPSHLESSSHAHSAPIRTMQTVSASSPSAANRDSTVWLPCLLNHDSC